MIQSKIRQMENKDVTYATGFRQQMEALALNLERAKG